MKRAVVRYGASGVLASLVSDMVLERLGFSAHVFSPGSGALDFVVKVGLFVLFFVVFTAFLAVVFKERPAN